MGRATSGVGGDATRRVAVRRPCGRVLLALLTAAALVVVVDPITRPVAVGATITTGSAGCTEGSLTWKVDYTLDTAFGGVIKADNLWKVPSGQPAQSANTSTWQLRWDNAAGEWPASPAPASATPFHEIQGQLSAVGVWQSVFTSPRLVTPDATCTIYLTPFVNLAALSAVPKVAVLGDDLLAQLNDASFNQGSRQGYVEADLAVAGIRSEVEGHTGAGWNPTPGTTGLARARTHLMDEFHGFAEWDLTGVVVGQGRNDALYIAAGTSPADIANRKTEVWNKVVGTFGFDMQARSTCAVVVTIPQNPSSADPDYADAASYLNDQMRASAALSATDALQIVDFGARATAHKYNDSQPWFTGADEATFTVAGRDAYRQAITEAAHLCADGLVMYGRPGSFTGGPLEGKSSVSTGQQYRAQGVAGWEFTGGHRPWLSAAMPDGTILNGNITHIASDATGNDMPLSAFNPDTGTFDTIQITTDRGLTEMSVNDPSKPQGAIPTGFGFGDITPLTDDSAVFVGTSGYRTTPNPQNIFEVLGLQDLETQGMWPDVGIVTKNPTTGRYEVAKGPDGPDADSLPDWENQWSPRELYDATVAADAADGVPPAQQGALADRACPPLTSWAGAPAHDPQGRPVRDCRSPQFVKVLPQSGDLLVGQYFRDIMILHLDGPDANGRYRIRVKAELPMPEIPDPQHPTDPTYGVHASPVSVSVDPTSQLGDERFIVPFDVYGPLFGQAGYGGPVEFSYDATEPDPALRIKATSAPLLSPQLVPGSDPDPQLPRYGVYGPALYDYQGNLWMAIPQGFAGYGIVVFTNDPVSGRRISSSPCFDPATPLENYVAGDGTTVRKAWGRLCTPNFLIKEGAALGHVWDLDEDPVTHGIFAIFNLGGTSLLIQPSGPPDNMSFQVGNSVVPAPRSIMAFPSLTGAVPCSGSGCVPCPDQPQYWQFGVKDCTQGTASVFNSVVDMAFYDRSGRAWLTLGQWRAQLPYPYTRDTQLDGWLESVNTVRMNGGERPQLTTVSGATTYIQAERTSTTGTRTQAGTVATTNIYNLAPVAGCGCVDPVSNLPGGLMLADETTPANGVPSGTTVEYKVVVPKAGSYTVSYNAKVATGTTGKPLNLSVNGGTAQSTTIPAGSTWPLAPGIAGPTVAFSTPGTYTLQLSAPSGGWQLDWLSLKRT